MADIAEDIDEVAPLDPQDEVGVATELVNAEAIYSVQRMAELLVKGPDPDREFVLFELQQLLDHCREDTMSVLVPVLCENIQDWSTDLQFRAAEALVRVVAVSLTPEVAWMIAMAAYRVVDRAETSVTDEAEREPFYELWGGVVNDALVHVDLDTEQHDTIVHHLDEGIISPLPARRKLAARVLGSLAQTLLPTDVTGVLLPRALQLALDTHVQVRGTAGESLAFIGAQLPVKVTETELWPLFLHFLDDPDPRVRATTLRTVSHILTAKKDKERSEVLYRDLLQPILLQWASFAKLWAQEDQRLVDDDTYLLLEVVAEVFGNFVHALALFAKLGFRKQAIRAYIAMATCNGPLIRRNCAFNMPGISLTLGPKYGSELSNIVEQFSRDTDNEVRGILASGMHHTVQHLVTCGRVDKLITAVANLLQDDSTTVRLFVLEHFAETLRALVREGDPNATRRLSPLLEHVRLLSQGDWHIQEQFARQLGDAVHLIPPTLLREKVLPLLLELTETGVYPVRSAAVHAMVRSFRYFRDVKERSEVVERFWVRLKNGSHLHRLCLLEGGRYSLECFSTALFERHFLKEIFEMAKDPISNVRLKLALMLPQLSTACEQTQEFIRAYHSLARDTDSDVRYAVRQHNRKAGKMMQFASEFDRMDRLKAAEEERLYSQKPRTQGLQGLSQAAEQMKVKMENLRTGSGKLPTLKRTNSRGSSVRQENSETGSIPDAGSNGSDEMDDSSPPQRPIARSGSIKETIVELANNLLVPSRKRMGARSGDDPGDHPDD